jgi:hypothetical protein
MGDYMQVRRRVVKEVEQAVENQIIKIIVGQQGPMEVSKAVPFRQLHFPGQVFCHFSVGQFLVIFVIRVKLLLLGPVTTQISSGSCSGMVP